MLTLAKLHQTNASILQSLLKIFYIFAAPLWLEQPAVRILLLFESWTQKGTQNICLFYLKTLCKVQKYEYYLLTFIEITCHVDRPTIV